MKLQKRHSGISPDAHIVSVGTQIYLRGVPESEYSGYINYGWEPERVRNALREFPEIILQEEKKQSVFHICYYARKPLFDIRKVRRALLSLPCHIIYSHGLYLDILPFRASKGSAVMYLARSLGIPVENVIVAGDSANDEEMLTAGYKGIIVGNYIDGLDSLRKNEDIYFAKGRYAAGILEHG